MIHNTWDVGSGVHIRSSVNVREFSPEFDPEFDPEFGKCSGVRSGVTECPPGSLNVKLLIFQHA